MTKLIEVFTDIRGKKKVSEREFESRAHLIKRIVKTAGIPSFVKYNLKKHGKAQIEYTNGTAIMQIVDVPESAK